MVAGRPIALQLRPTQRLRILLAALAVVLCAVVQAAAAEPLVGELAALDAAGDSTRKARDARTLKSSADAVRGWAPGSIAQHLETRTPSHFVLRRVPNPNYRERRSRGASLGPGTVSRLRAVDHVSVQFTRRGEGSANPISEWEITAGEQYRENRSIEAGAAFHRERAGTSLRAGRLSARSGALMAMAGDVTPVVVDGIATLHRLRGGLIASEPREGPIWRVLGGVPTPVPGAQVRRLGLGGFTLDRLEVDEAMISFGMFGFGRGEAERTAFGRIDPDSLAGGGGEAYMGVRAPTPLGTLNLTIAGGWHDLDGLGGLTARHALEWRFTSPELVASIRDERSTERSRELTVDALRASASREDRWNVRMRALGGRGETHFTGVIRDGGNPDLETQTVQVGGSGGWGASPWYSGADFTWDRRGSTKIAERRLSLHTGRASRGGHAMVLRLRRNSDDSGREAIQAAGEALFALPRGMRLSVEPRVSWGDRVFQDSHLESRVTMPLPWLSARLLGGIAFGAGRTDGFSPELREVEVALSLMPRSRDRGDFEMRRQSGNATPSYEYSAAYQLEASRYESPTGSWLSRADSGRVIVRVVRSGNLSGVANALVSLDDTELRFTDEDGFAHFDRVPPGIHVVAVEERSLPEKYEIVQTARVFVTIERGRIPDPVVFQVARPVRRTKF